MNNISFFLRWYMSS